jgi:DNA-binding transcriptional LysR family regulator
MWMISMPPKRVQAHRRSLNPSIGRVRRFIVGALRPDVDAREFIQQELISEGMVLVARSGHPLADRDKVTLNDLNSVAWILPRDGTPARVLINGLFEQKNMATPAPTVETVDLAVIRGVLRCSDMVAAVSAQQLRAEIQSGELIVLDIDMPYVAEWQCSFTCGPHVDVSASGGCYAREPKVDANSVYPRAKCRGDKEVGWLLTPL